MAQTDRDDIELEAFFAAARRQSAGQPGVAEAAEPGADLMARILGDALAVQTAAIADTVPVQSVNAPRDAGIWRQFFGALGGWPGVAGLTAAAAVGGWLAISPPQTLSDTVLAYMGGAADQAQDLGMEQTIAFLSGG